MWFEVYKDRRGEWRWRLVAENGRIVADSAEGYTRPEDAERSVNAIKNDVSGAPIQRRLKK